MVADPATELARARAHFFLPQRMVDPFGNATTIAHDGYDLLPLETRDALDNVVTAGERDASGALITTGLDYRVLAPRLVTDPNGNRMAVAYDTRGLVVGCAVMGKRDEVPRRGDLLDGFVADLPDDVVAAHLTHPLADPAGGLRQATTRIIYDLFAYHRTRGEARPAPNVAYTVARETHDADLAAGQLTRYQHNLTYSDGLGREIQKKVQAEAGPVPVRDGSGAIVVGGDGLPVMTTGDVSPRWVGSGWVVFDNKGHAVRKLEPFFTDRHTFEPDLRIGVSSTQFYDPAGRVVATLHPDHRWEKVVFDAWQQVTWDATDTILIEDPRLDPDVGDYFHRLADTEFLPTWYGVPQSGSLGTEEQNAAASSAVHAVTPSLAYTDSLGRAVLVVTHNRFTPAGAPSAPPVDELYRTRSLLDIENNVREVRDPRDRVVVRYDYDMRGGRARQTSMESGERWGLSDVAGKPVRAWNSRGHVLRIEYDALERPLRRFVQGALPAQPTVEILFEATDYGEGQPDDKLHNLRTRTARRFDGGGRVVFDDYDFKGNLVRSTQRLASEYKAIPDWAANPALDSDAFITTTAYDAFGRVVQATAPDGSASRATFNEAGFLETVDVRLQGSATDTPFVTAISYDAKGQRQRIAYGSGVTTDYSYDPTSFRLTQLRTLRGSQVLQDLSYTHDAGGHVSHVRDVAQQTIYFANQVVVADCDFTYDATHRLIAAAGREHIGSVSIPLERDRIFISHTHPNGTPYASQSDQDVLTHLENIGSPQRSSVVVPVGKGTAVRYDAVKNRR